jgi:uncharacterized OB-fold protein
MNTPLQLPEHDVPHAVPDDVSAPFWDGCANGELRYQRCTRCAAAAFPPTAACRRCLSTELVWTTSTGVGRLYSWTVVWRPVTPAFPAPYAPAIVDVADGFQMVTNLVDATVEELAPDLPLAVVFRTVGELTLPYFTPVRSDSAAEVDP